MSDPQFWSDQTAAKKVAKRTSDMKTQIEDWAKFESDLTELSGITEMAVDEADKRLEADLNAKFRHLKGLFEEFRLTTFLSAKYDNHDAILSIHAGAGGVDAQDWAEILLRMYLKYAENKKFRASIIDESRGGEAGIKSVVVEISGPYAYGYFKSEAGVHRLVRQSPFNSGQTRETSFAHYRPNRIQTEHGRS